MQIIKVSEFNLDLTFEVVFRPSKSLRGDQRHSPISKTSGQQSNPPPFCWHMPAPFPLRHSQVVRSADSTLYP